MFRKYYKAANDDIKPNRALIDKVFEVAESENKRSSKVYKFGLKYGTAVAAVFVLAVSAFLYPQIVKTNEDVENLTITAKNTQDDIKENELNEANIAYSSKTTEGIKEAAGESKKLMPENINDTADIAESKISVNTEEVTKFSAAESAHQSGTSARIMGNLSADNTCTADVDEVKEVTEEEITFITSLLYEKFGKIDKDTQNTYVFEISGKFDTADKTLYLGRWRWLVDGHSSLLTEFVVDYEVSKMYECIISDSSISWTTENNMIKK